MLLKCFQTFPKNIHGRTVSKRLTNVYILFQRWGEETENDCLS